MARHEPQVNFRIPADLKANLEVDAKRNNRTLTAEIVARLQGTPPIDRLKEQMEKSWFETNYMFARFGIQTFLHVGQMVIDDDSKNLRQTKSFKLLQQIVSTMRIPPELPTPQPPVAQDALGETVQGQIEELKNVAETLGARNRTKTAKVKPPSKIVPEQE